MPTKRSSNRRRRRAAGGQLALSNSLQKALKQKELERLLEQVLSPVWGSSQRVGKTPRSDPGFHLTAVSQVKIGWRPEERGEIKLLNRDESLGTSLLPPGVSAGTPRDVVLGLDFGTSSTKVVLADHALKAAYAVPFNDAVGVSSYLLPSTLVESQDAEYSLAGTGVRHPDLKLALLSCPEDEVICSRVCAYLALVIRSARAWLYQTKREQYLYSEIFWALALGVPTDQAAYDAHREYFEHLAKVAWHLAGRAGPIRKGDALKAWRQREHLDLGEELEVRVMPELSAQIHGFVSSTHFNPGVPNIYLMADVGAGTLDASLFHVRKDRGGTVSFGLFTHTVELLGAANMNRYRLDWWQSALKRLNGFNQSVQNEWLKTVQSVLSELESLKLPTDFSGSYPPSYKNHVHGVNVRFEDGAKSPDDDFYQKVRNQVVGRVLYGSWKKQLLSAQAVKGMPFFLCGGGAKHSLYSSLKSRLQNTPGCSWLSVTPRPLVLPSNMSAPGITHGDYDRLSVAYGLSQLNLGAFEVVKTLRPAVVDSKQTDWSSLAPDKSVC